GRANVVELDPAEATGAVQQVGGQPREREDRVCLRERGGEVLLGGRNVHCAARMRPPQPPRPLLVEVAGEALSDDRQQTGRSDGRGCPSLLALPSWRRRVGKPQRTTTLPTRRRPINDGGGKPAWEVERSPDPAGQSGSARRRGRGRGRGGPGAA